MDYNDLLPSKHAALPAAEPTAEPEFHVARHVSCYGNLGYEARAEALAVAPVSEADAIEVPEPAPIIEEGWSSLLTKKNKIAKKKKKEDLIGTF